jgi:fluoroacetyl-CoA thioesterase
LRRAPAFGFGCGGLADSPVEAFAKTGQSRLQTSEGGNIMKPTLVPGTSRTRRVEIGRERTISFMGEEARTYSTPSMIHDIEYTCRDLILEHADDGEDSVGMEVAVRHLAPTLLGMTVEIAVRVASVEGRKVVFEVAVKDDLDTVGAGTHTRFVVEKAKTLERLKAKAARIAAEKS